MKVHNARLGFATNSSSTHSLVFMHGSATDSGLQGEDFGWEFFTAGSLRTKMRYLGIALRDAIGESLPQSIRDLVVESLCGERIGENCYIDHQSMPTMPKEFGRDFIDMSFAAEFGEFLKREDVAILGGNDNTDERHHLDDGMAFALPFRDMAWSGEMSCRKTDDHWVLFNRANGSKIRISFDTLELRQLPRLLRLGLPEEHFVQPAIHLPKTLFVFLVHCCLLT